VVVGEPDEGFVPTVSEEHVLVDLGYRFTVDCHRNSFCERDVRDSRIANGKASRPAQ
jgi:hypothetical protein